MEKKKKLYYETPSTDEFEVRVEGMVCASEKKDGSSGEGFTWD